MFKHMFYQLHLQQIQFIDESSNKRKKLNNNVPYAKRMYFVNRSNSTSSKKRKTKHRKPTKNGKTHTHILLRKFAYRNLLKCWRLCSVVVMKDACEYKQ